LPFVTYTLAIALSSAKRHAEAMAAFAKAQAEAELSREEMLNSVFFYSYGAVAEQAGELEKAAELLRHSIQLDPNSPEPYNHLGYMWVDRGENLEEAGELIKKALELEPNNGAYLDSFGWYLLKKGEPDRALKELLRASENIQRENKREDAVVLDHIGDAYQRLGKTAEALTYWQRSLALEPAEKKIEEKIEAAKQKVTSSTSAPAEPVR
jgi:Tfp pilus assembly protein PilF